MEFVRNTFFLWDLMLAKLNLGKLMNIPVLWFNYHYHKQKQLYNFSFVYYLN